MDAKNVCNLISYILQHTQYTSILFMALFTNITPISLRLHFRVPYRNGMTAIPKFIRAKMKITIKEQAKDSQYFLLPKHLQIAFCLTYKPSLLPSSALNWMNNLKKCPLCKRRGGGNKRAIQLQSEYSKQTKTGLVWCLNWNDKSSD